MIRLLPAVLIGGPSHPDKSVLFYGLTKALRARHVLHHALRVHSSNEELWCPAEDQAHVRLLSISDADSSGLVEPISRDLSQRLLPLLIDMDVDHQYLRASILQRCTHLVLPPHKLNNASQNLWLQLGERYGLLPLVNFSSFFENTISATTAPRPLISDTSLSQEQSPIEREDLFDCLVGRITNLFSTYSHEELVKLHIRQAPGELVLHLSMLLQSLAPGDETWEPHMLPAVLEYIPAHTSLSIYGPGP